MENSVKSQLFSPSDIQSIMKKAMVERLKSVYHVEWFEEDGPSYPVRGAFMNEVAMMAANIAPGMNRSFLSEDWKNLISRKHWYNIHDEDNDLVNGKIFRHFMKPLEEVMKGWIPGPCI